MDARLCGSRRSFRCAALAARRRAPQSKRRQPNELLHGVPECAGSRALAAGLQALAAGRKHRAAALFLRAERVAQDQALRAAARRSVDTAAIEVPSPARREGSLLMREVAQGGRASAARAFEEVGAPAADATGRFEPWLVGGEVPRVDCQTPEGFQRALGYVARRVPVVMLNLDLMPASKRWDVEYLRSHTNEWPGMNVLRSGGENRYLYYVPEQADRDMSAFQHAPRRASADLRLSFENFLAAAQQDPQGRYYLQAPLVLRQADGRGLRETWSPGIGAELRAAGRPGSRGFPRAGGLRVPRGSPAFGAVAGRRRLWLLVALAAVCGAWPKPVARPLRPVRQHLLAGRRREALPPLRPGRCRGAVPLPCGAPLRRVFHGGPRAHRQPQLPQDRHAAKARGRGLPPRERGALRANALVAPRAGCCSFQPCLEYQRELLVRHPQGAAGGSPSLPSTSGA
ncbi:unnamed protein product [Effrenium voratum]|nr:unnamed protein product [Effrenium voratum]